MQRRTLIQHSLASALLLGTALAAMPAAAQGNWPTGKPITYLVPFPPGGNTDTLAR
ncbi:MAG: MFS transporter, partial [Delftia sp.]|nr:MFS transporter [Delftia sp.]